MKDLSMNKDNTRLAIINDDFFSDSFYQGEEAFHMAAVKKSCLAIYNKTMATGDIFSTANAFVDEFGGIILEIFPSHLKDGTKDEAYSTSIMVFKGDSVSENMIEKTITYLQMLESGYKDFHPLTIDGILVYTTGEMYEFPTKEERENCIRNLSNNRLR